MIKMREIKFRGKSEDGAWVYGDLLKYGSTYPVITGRHDADNVKRGSIGQYIGIKDRNGAEIYEGDIVTLEILDNVFNNEHFKLSNGLEKTALLKWDLDDHCFSPVFAIDDSGMNPAYDHMRLVDNNVEVIGNIFDNPDLFHRRQSKEKT